MLLSWCVTLCVFLMCWWQPLGSHWYSSPVVNFLSSDLIWGRTEWILEQFPWGFTSSVTFEIFLTPPGHIPHLTSKGNVFFFSSSTCTECWIYCQPFLHSSNVLQLSGSICYPVISLHMPWNYTWILAFIHISWPISIFFIALALNFELAYQMVTIFGMFLNSTTLILGKTVSTICS